MALIELQTRSIKRVLFQMQNVRTFIARFLKIESKKKKETIPFYSLKLSEYIG